MRADRGLVAISKSLKDPRRLDQSARSLQRAEEGCCHLAAEAGTDLPSSADGGAELPVYFFGAHFMSDLLNIVLISVQGSFLSREMEWNQ